jgi:hypothetical protein
VTGVGQPDEFDVAGPARNRLVDHAGPFWSSRRVREVLGLKNNDELMSAVERADLLALFTSDAVLIFPVWQFEHHGVAIRVKPALAAIFKILRGHDAWAVATVLKSPDHYDLEGQSAVQVADHGDPHGILETFALRVHREWRQGAEDLH